MPDSNPIFVVDGVAKGFADGHRPLQALQPVSFQLHAGDRARQDSLAGLSTPGLEVTALKRADDGDGLILRVAEVYGRGAHDELRCAGQTFPVALAPCEVATFRLRLADARWQLTPCDMLER